VTVFSGGRFIRWTVYRSDILSGALCSGAFCPFLITKEEPEVREM